MSFDIVLEKLKESYFVDDQKILPVFVAWSALIYAHDEGFITYRVKDGSYSIDDSRYSRKVKQWEKKRDDLQPYCKENITLDNMPLSPAEIGKNLSIALIDREEFEVKEIFIALGYGKITGMDEDEKMKKSIRETILSAFKRQ